MSIWGQMKGGALALCLWPGALAALGHGLTEARDLAVTMNRDGPMTEETLADLGWQPLPPSSYGPDPATDCYIHPGIAADIRACRGETGWTVYQHALLPVPGWSGITPEGTRIRWAPGAD